MIGPNQFPPVGLLAMIESNKRAVPLELHTAPPILRPGRPALLQPKAPPPVAELAASVQWTKFTMPRLKMPPPKPLAPDWEWLPHSGSYWMPYPPVLALPTNVQLVRSASAEL